MSGHPKLSPEQTMNVITFSLSTLDRLRPDNQLQELKSIKRSLTDLVAQHGILGRAQATTTAEQTKAIVTELSNLTLQHDDTGRLVTTAIDQQTRALVDEIVRFSSQHGTGTALLGTATLEQTEAIVSQTARQVEGLAGISSEMSKTNKMLDSIATELKVLSKPDLCRQIMSAGALLTNMAAVAQIKRLADETARVADGLDRLADNVYSENSRGDKFPGHVHSYIRSMIEKHQEDKAPHYFFVFNQSTTWHPKFDDMKRADPLGEQFLGYYHDLDVLVDFVVSTARPRLGPDPVIHILMPTISQLAITESLTFPQGMGPVRVDGQLGESGLPMVYLCMPLEQDRQNLTNIGLLRPRRRWVLIQRIGVCLPIIAEWLSIRPDPVFFEEPLFAVSTTVGTPVYLAAYVPTNPVPPRSLGTIRQ